MDRKETLRSRVLEPEPGFSVTLQNNRAPMLHPSFARPGPADSLTRQSRYFGSLSLAGFGLAAGFGAGAGAGVAFR